MEKVNKAQAGSCPAGTGPLTCERWVLLRWTALCVTMQHEVTGEIQTVPLDRMTGFTVSNINKCAIGDTFERVYIGGQG